MAVKFKMSKHAYAELLRMLTPTLNSRAVAIADACNAESSWGYYQADTAEDFVGGWIGEQLPSPRVYALNAASDGRSNRLLRVTASHMGKVRRAKEAKK